MKTQQLNTLDKALDDMGLALQHPVIEALIRNEIASDDVGSEQIARRLYGLSEILPPGEDGPLIFEQTLFDFYKEIKGKFNKETDQKVITKRDDILDFVDRWMQLNDFLQEEPRVSLPGMEIKLKELLELFNFVQSLLDNLNHPEEEDQTSLEEIEFLFKQSEDTFWRLAEEINEILNPKEEAELKTSASYLLLKVILIDSPYPIWRTFQVPSSLNLSQFNKVLQKVIGWWDLYNHCFKQGNKVFGGKNPEEDVLLSSLLEEEYDQLFFYYDIDSEEDHIGWQHRVEVLSVLNPSDHSSAQLSIACLDGSGECPPEDCGGMEGFDRLVASRRDDASEELKADFKWALDYQADNFSIDKVNKALQELII